MKYPKHLILDLATPTAMPRLSLYRQKKHQRSAFPSDQLILRRLSSVKHIKTVFDLVNMAYASSSRSDTPQVGDMLDRIKNQKRDRYDPWLLTNAHILVKEKLYTKLKYSRCPQYDIVSGGFAALFAGFIGFLISEKFGIELVDSGDFYIALMYAVIASCAVRPLIQSYTKRYTLYHPFSYKYLITFYSDISRLLLQFIKDR